MRKLIILLFVFQMMVSAKGGEGGGTGVTPTKIEAAFVDTFGIDGGGRFNDDLSIEIKKRLSVLISPNIKNEKLILMPNKKVLLQAPSEESVYSIVNKLYESNLINQEAFNAILD